MRERLSDGHPADFLAIYVGRISREKNVPQLREALDQLSGVRLAMVGGGPEFEQIKPIFDGTPTHFTGFLRGDELVSAMASADVLVFPSTSETFGLAPLEAMACGLPVVASMSGGLVDTLRHGVNALTHTPNDPASIADCVRQLQHAPELLARLRTGALEHAQARQWQETMDQLIHYYELTIRVHQQRGGGRHRRRQHLQNERIVIDRNNSQLVQSK